MNENLIDQDKKNSLTENIKINFKDSIYATGRRKKSIARVWLKKGSGNFQVNRKKMENYFTRPNHQMLVLRPLSLTKRDLNFDIRCTVSGGGMSGQAGAVIHGVSRALCEYEPSLKTLLKKEKLTTRDPRAVERKKYGRKKARRSFQFSKR